MKHSLSRSLLVAAGGILFATAAFGQQPPPGAGVRPVVKPQAVAPQVAPDNGLGMAQLGAFVNANGTVGFGAGVTGVVTFGAAGLYEIQFNRDVTQCIYSANSFDSANKVIQQLQPRAGNPNGVFLRITTSDGANTNINGSFYVTVFCNK